MLKNIWSHECVQRNRPISVFILFWTLFLAISIAYLHLIFFVFTVCNPCVSQILFLYTALFTAMTAHATTQLHTQLPLVSLNNKTRKTTIHMVQRHFRTALTLCTLSSSNHHVPCQCGGWQDRVEIYFYVWSYSFVSKSTEKSIKKQLNE